MLRAASVSNLIKYTKTPPKRLFTCGFMGREVISMPSCASLIVSLWKKLPPYVPGLINKSAQSPNTYVKILQMKSTGLKKPVIIFDFGGVLVDWNPHYLFSKLPDYDPDYINQFLKEVDFSLWNLELDRGHSFDIATAELCQRFPHYCHLITTYHHRFPESISGPKHEVVSVLANLRNAGYRLFGLSNWNDEKFNLMKDEFPFFTWFEDIVISGEVKLVKPDRAIFQLLLERINAPAQDCLLIDDSAENVETAEQMGFMTIHFQNPLQLQLELQARGILNIVS